MKFNKRGDCPMVKQDFDREKMTTTKGGNTYNTYDAIQAANVDTNIYEVMKKYHCKEDEAVALMQQRGGVQGIYMDIIEMQKQCTDIADVLNIQKKAQTMFEELPTEIKEKYGNNLTQFLKDVEKQQKQTQTQTEPVKEQQGGSDVSK